jgi:hypothetical protein
VSDDLIVLPYVQRLLVWFLLAQDEVTALVDQNVYTDLPATPDWPVVRVSTFPGRIIEGGSIYWLEQTLAQVDVWGGPRVLTHDIAETCRSTLKARLNGAVEFGAVSAVVTEVQVGGIRDDSDADYTPAKPHARFDVTVTAHPGPVVS